MDRGFGFGGRVARRRAHRRRILVGGKSRSRQVEALEGRHLLCGAALCISEFMAQNESTLADVDGEFSDWLEIHNASETPVDLTSWYLTDLATELTQWEFPAVTLAADDYLVVFASAKDRRDPAAELHTNFRLAASGEYLALMRPDQAIAHAYSNDNGGFPSQFGDISFGLNDQDQERYFLSPTPGQANSGLEVLDATPRIVINEILYHPGGVDPLTASDHEYIELYNASVVDVDLGGWRLRDAVSFTFPAGQSIGAGDYLVVAADLATFGADYPGDMSVVGGWTGELHDRSDTIDLEDQNGARVDRVTYADEGDWSVRARGPDDQGHRGWIWLSEHDGGGSSLELIQPALANNRGQNWKASAVVGGTPGETNSVYANDLAPMIVDLEQAPLVPHSTDTVVISAELRDEDPASASLALWYRLDQENNSDPFLEVPLADDGQGADLLAGDGRYTGEIPAQIDGAIVEYYLQAGDGGGNLRSWPAPALLQDGATTAQAANLLYQVDDAFSGAYLPGDRPTFYIVMTEDERAELEDIGDGPAAEAESNAQMNATLVIVDGSGEAIRYQTGVRNRGSSSRVGPPNNQRVNVPHDQPVDGVVEFTFNVLNPHSQTLGSVIFQASGLVSENARPVDLVVNGAFIGATGGPQYGIYAQLEPLGSDFVNNHFPDDADGNLYTVRDVDGGDEGDLRFEGNDPDAYRDTYFKKTNEAIDDWTDLIGLTDALNQDPTNPDFLANVAQHANLDQWFRFFATDSLLVNREGGLGTGRGDDYSFYRGVDDSRFVLLPHDMDTLLGQGATFQEDYPLFIYADVDGLENLFDQPEAIALYYKNLLELTETVFAPETFNAYVDQLAASWEVAPAITQQLKDRAAARVAWVRSQLPTALTVNSGLSPAGPSQIPRTTNSDVLLSGESHAALTRSVTVNGQLAQWNQRSGTWSLDTLAFLNPGINRLVVEAQDAEGHLIDARAIDVWYDDGDEEIVGAFGEDFVVTRGATWKYLDDGSNPGPTWKDPDFDDASWQEGPAELGFGDGDESTELAVGETTYFFRHTFEVADVSTVESLDLRFVRDDGAAVYLNGVEIARDNLAANAGINDFALQNQAGAAESTPVAFSVPLSSLPAGTLVAGQNTLAVEVHQASASSADLGLDLSLSLITSGTAGCPPEVTWTAANGPYHVVSDFVVASCTAMVIEPGTSVFFDEGVEMIVEGTLTAVGTPYQRIRFTSHPAAAFVPDVPTDVAVSNSAPPRWRGLHYVGSVSPDNIVSYADFEYAQDSENNDGSIGAIDSELIVDNATFRGTHLRMVYGDSSSLIVRNSLFADMFGPGEAADALHLDNIAEHVKTVGPIPADGLLLVENNIFGTNKGHNDVIDVESGRRPDPIAQIVGNVFTGTGDELLDLGGDVWISDNFFTGVFKDDETSDRGYANVISTGDGGRNTVIAVARNIFYDVDHAINLKVDTSTIFENNTVFTIHPDFDDRFGNPNVASAINLFVDEPNAQAGDGAYVEGNIFWDTPRVFGNPDEDGTTNALVLNNNFLEPHLADNTIGNRPGTILDLGTGNLLGDPRIVDALAANFSLAPGSPARGTGPFGQDFGALTAPGVWIEGAAHPITDQTNMTLTIGGPGFFAYQYRVNGGDWSESTPIGNGFDGLDTVRRAPLELTDLADGTYQVDVIGQDFAGNWQVEPTSIAWTVDTVNPLPIDLVINEVLALNTGVHDLGGTLPDYIELSNRGAGAVDLSGMRISDSADGGGAYTFPAATILASGDYLLLYADDNQSANGEIHLGFSLNSDGEGVYLFDGNGDLRDQLVFGLQIANLSVGHLPDGSIGLGRATPGAANVPQALGAAANLKINEWFTLGNFDFMGRNYSNDYIELYNPASLPVALGGLHLTDNLATQPDKHTIAPLSYIAPTRYTLFQADNDPQQGANHVDFRLASDRGWIGLLDAGRGVIDLVYYGPQVAGVSQGRVPDGGSQIQFFAQPTPAIDFTPPSTPALLRITFLSDTQVDFRWNPSVDAESGVSLYRVFRDGQEIGATSDTSFSDTTLEAGVTYSYSVSAINGDMVESDPSVPISTDMDVTPPTTPEDLRAILVSRGEVSLSWSESFDPETGVRDYNVFRDGVLIAMTPETSFTDSEAPRSGEIRYQVSATNTDNAVGLLSGSIHLGVFQDLAGVYSGTTDTWMSNNFPNRNNGDDNSLEVDGQGPFSVTLIRWDVSSIPTSATITSVAITIDETNNSNNNEYDILEMLRDWSEGAANWTQADVGANWETPGAQGPTDHGGDSLGTIASNNTGEHTYLLNANGIAVVQSWIDNSQANRGFLFSDADSTNGFVFDSSEAANEARHPRLSISFLPNLDETPPTAPTNVTASDNGIVDVTLQWDAASDEESGISRYQVFRDGQLLGTSSETTYVDRTASAGVEYQYTVRALNGSGLPGEASDPPTAHSIPLDESPPTTPTNLMADDNGFSSITLSWSAASDAETGISHYNVYRDGELVAGAPRAFFTDVGRMPNTVYTYEVSAVNAHGLEGDRSASLQHELIPSEVNLRLSVRDSYLPGVAVLVRLEVTDRYGNILRDQWDAQATLTASDPNVTLTDPVTGQPITDVLLYNGQGSLLVAFENGQDFTLTASINGLDSQRQLRSLAGEPITEASGTLLDSQVWSGIVRITDDLAIPAGDTLTILPGTLVLLDGDAVGQTDSTTIEVRGTLRAEGTQYEPITFTSFDPDNIWGQINVNGGFADLDYTVITRAGNAPHQGHTDTGAAVFVRNDGVFDMLRGSITDLRGKVMQATSGDVTMVDSLLSRAVMGPEIENTSLQFHDNWILEMAGVYHPDSGAGDDDNDGIYLHDQQAGQIIALSGGVIANVLDDGIDTLDADVTIDNYLVRDVVDKAVSILSGEVWISRSLLVHADIGVNTKGSGSSTPDTHIANTTIAHVNYGIVAEDKDAPDPDVLITYDVTSSIILVNEGGDPVSTDYDPLDIHINYSLVQEDWNIAGSANNLNTDPMLVDLANNNFQLLPLSPAIDAGDPASLLDADGTRSDMGAFPFLQDVALLPVEVRLAVRDTYLPGSPVLVRVELADLAGETAKDVWNATAVISTSDPGVRITDPVTGQRVSQFPLYNGVGSMLVRFDGGSEFSLIAAVAGVRAEKTLVSLAEADVTTVSGTIDTDTTWSGVVRVVDRVLVTAGATLTIEPGSLILLDGDAVGAENSTEIQVEGALHALGTAQSPITFTATDINTPWGQFDIAGGQIDLEYAIITGAGNSPHGGHTDTGPALTLRNDGVIDFQNVTVSDIRGKIIQATSGDMIVRDSLFTRAVMGPEIEDTSLLFENNWIIDMAGRFHPDGTVNDNDAFYIHQQQAGQTIVLRGGVAALAQDDGFDTWDAVAVIEDYLIRDIDDNAIGQTGGELLVQRTLITDSANGFKADELSGDPALAELDRVTIVGVNRGLEANDTGNPTPDGVVFDVRNSIILPRVGGQVIDSEYDPQNIRLNYSLAPIDWNSPGSGNNINSDDPQFVDPSNHDYRLLPTSPAIDAGDPNSTADPDGTVADLGAFYFPQAVVQGPKVVSVEINAGLLDPPDRPSGPQPASWATQRSDIRQLVVTFDQPVLVSEADLVLVNLGVNAPVDGDATIPLTASHLESSGNQLVIRFAAYELPNGVYSLQILPSATNSSGAALDGNGDGTGGDAFVMVGNDENRFYKIAAEFNGDHGVSIFDFPAFSYWFGSAAPPDYMDLNADGGVTIFDFPIFSGNFARGAVFPAPPFASGLLVHESLDSPQTRLDQRPDEQRSPALELASLEPQWRWAGITQNLDSRSVAGQQDRAGQHARAAHAAALMDLLADDDWMFP